MSIGELRPQNRTSPRSKIEHSFVHVPMNLLRDIENVLHFDPEPVIRPH